MSHILLMDDQPYMRKFLAEDLADDGHRLTCVEAADELMESIRESRPDVVLLDLFHQGFARWDLLREIKRDQPTLPVLIFSAYESLRDDPRAASADGYVVKNFLTDKLKEKIHDVMRQNSMIETHDLTRRHDEQNTYSGR